jgi:hypothetical protein
VFAVIALAAVATGCAKRGPPSGGPPDLDPPAVVSATPDSGASHVPLDAHISITFSEPMEPRSGADAVALAPPVDIAKRGWHGRTLVLELGQPLEPNQTYTLFVAGTARDRHGNAMGPGASVVFSTADSFPRGRITGEIEARGFAAPGLSLWCYHALREHVPDSTARDFDAIGLVDRLDQFRVDGLEVPGRYKLWAFADLNSNRSFEPEVDILAPVDTTFDLTPEHPEAAGVKITVINPRAPGTLKGTVVDSLADTVGVLRVLATSESDTSKKVLASVDRDHVFELELNAGPWTVRAFRDLDDSRSWQPELERASEPRHFQVFPASAMVDLVIPIRRHPGGP